MGNGNLRKMMGKRNKWGLASGNKLLLLFMLRRKARPFGFLYLIFISDSQMSFAIGKSLLFILHVSLLDRFLRTIGRTR